MAEDLSNPSMAALLTEFTVIAQTIVNTDGPREEQLEHIAGTLEGVTDELKTYCSSWKTATQQAEDGARQIAGKNEELEETRRQMAKKNEELEERRKQIETQEELLSRKERLFESRRIDLEKKEEVLQRFQSTVAETLRELTGAVPKAQADAQRSLINYDVSRFEEIRAKRGLGPTSPEEPPPKRRRYTPQSSVRCGEMPTSSGRPEPLPNNVLNRIRSPRGQGGVTMVVNPRREDESSPIRRRPTDTSGTVSTASGGRDPLGTSIGSQNALHSGPSSSSIDPATATGERSSQGAMIPSSQSAASVTDIPALSDASDEVKQVWAHIDFPANWGTETSKMLLNGLNKNTGRKITARYRPAGLLNSAAAHPICLRRKLAKVNPAVETDDTKCCSDCKARKIQCVSVSYVAEGLADVEYDEDGEEKRWKLTIREG